MCHVVDKIVFHLGEFLLPKCRDDGKQEGYQQNEREGKRGYHEFYRTRYIISFGREIDFQVVIFAGGSLGNIACVNKFPSILGSY